MSRQRRRETRAKDLVGFRVGEVKYAVRILRVREIIHPLALVEVPHAPPVVVGVADHRGAVVPVIDLRLRFGLVPNVDESDSKWIVIQLEQGAAALVVDEVTEVFASDESKEENAPVLGVHDDARGIASVCRYNAELVFVVDVDRVGAPAEALDLQGMQRLGAAR